MNPAPPAKETKKPKAKKKSLVVCPGCGGQLVQDKGRRVGHCLPCKKSFTWLELYERIFNGREATPKG